LIKFAIPRRSLLNNAQTARIVYSLSKQWRDGCRRLAVAMTGVGVYSLQFSLNAQSVLAPPPEGYGGASVGVPASSTNQAFTASLVAAPEPPPLPSALQWGPVDVRPHFLYRFVYGDGIQAVLGQSSKTAINEVYAGVLFDLGKNWTLDYTPAVSIYSSSQFQNTVDQSVSLHGAASYGDWSFNLQQSYGKTTEPLVETGEQTEEDTYLTSLMASWAMNSKLNLQIGLSQNFLDAGNFQSLKEWTTPEWLDYRITTGFSMGLGVTLGYVSLSLSPHETFEEGQGRIQWNPGPKLSIQTSGGVEDRQLGGGAPDLITPVFGASINYQAFEHTRLGLNLSRSVSPSLFQSQVQTSTSLSATLHQDITKKLALSIDGSYFYSPYQNTALVPITGPFLNGSANQAVGPVPTALLQTDRTDTQWSVDIHLSWALTDHGTIDVFYSRSENTSGLTLFSYSSVQVGFSLGYRF